MIFYPQTRVRPQRISTQRASPPRLKFSVSTRAGYAWLWGPRANRSLGAKSGGSAIPRVVTLCYSTIVN